MSCPHCGADKLRREVKVKRHIDTERVDEADEAIPHADRPGLESTLKFEDDGTFGSFNDFSPKPSPPYVVYCEGCWAIVDYGEGYIPDLERMPGTSHTRFEAFLDNLCSYARSAHQALLRARLLAAYDAPGIPDEIDKQLYRAGEVVTEMFGIFEFDDGFEEALDYLLD